VIPFAEDGAVRGVTRLLAARIWVWRQLSRPTQDHMRRPRALVPGRRYFELGLYF